MIALAAQRRTLIGRLIDEAHGRIRPDGFAYYAGADGVLDGDELARAAEAVAAARALKARSRRCHRG